MQAPLTKSFSFLALQHAVWKLKESSFVRNILVVMSGTAAAQIIGLVLTPIISRLFSPSDFGVFGSFNSIATIIAAGSTLQYTQAIMLPKEKEDALHLLFVSFLCTLIVAFLILTACSIAPSFFNNLMKTSGLWALALLFAGTITSGLNQSFQAWCVRSKAFNDTSVSQLIRSASSSGSQITFGYLKTGAPGLILSSVLADILATVNLARVFIPDFLALRHSIRWSRMKKLAIEYRDFPMYSASQNVINALSSGLPVLLLTQFYGITVAGAYAFAMRILQAPMGLMLTALRQVLFQKAAETQHQGGSLASLYVRTSAGLFATALCPSVILFIWAPELFSWIFGSQWMVSGDFARSLVLWMLFVFCNLPAVLFARLIRIQRTVFFYDLGLLGARVTTLVLGGMYLKEWETVMLFSSVGALMNLFLILFVGYSVMKKEGRVNYERIRDCLIGHQS